MTGRRSLLLAALLLACASRSPHTGGAQERRPPEPRLRFMDLIRHIPQGGDDPLRQDVSGPEEWGQIVGTWTCTLRTPDDQGAMTESRARWTWEYILGGVGVRDVYHGLDADGNPRFRGTAIRVYDPETGAWEIAWGDDASRSIRRYSATYSDGRMVMRREDDPEWRTVFHDITDTRFDWLNEPSGQRMRCVEESRR